MRITKLQVYFISGIMALALQGCTMSSGALQPNTQFVYPNSNVRILGPVKAEISKWSFMGIGGFFDAKDIRDTYQKALSQQSGANVLVNFKEDSDFTTYILMVNSTYRISGDAASMEVGNQILK